MTSTFFSNYNTPNDAHIPFVSQEMSYEKLLEGKLTALLKQSLVYCGRDGAVSLRMVDQTKVLIQSIDEALPGLEIRLRDDVIEFFDKFGE